MREKATVRYKVSTPSDERQRLKVKGKFPLTCVCSILAVSKPVCLAFLGETGDMGFVSSFSVDELGDFLLEKGIPPDIVSSFTGMVNP